MLSQQGCSAVSRMNNSHDAAKSGVPRLASCLIVFMPSPLLYDSEYDLAVRTLVQNFFCHAFPAYHASIDHQASQGYFSCWLRYQVA